MGSEGGKDFVRVLLAYFLPPVGVFLQCGMGTPFVLNVLLTFLFFFPAQLHAIWVIATTREDGSEDPNGMNTFISLLLAALLPPVGVFMKKGAGAPLIINIVLCFFFWIPAILHAAWVITNDD